MSTRRQITFMVLDELKLLSDDAYYTEEHILYLMDKYRAFLLRLKYNDIRKEVPTSNYQTLCLDLILVPAIAGVPCYGGTYLRSKEKIPNQISVGNNIVAPVDYYQGTNITLVDRERMRYVGHNKYLQNIIYCSLGPDNYLYFTGCNPLFLHLEKVNYTGIFESANLADSLCENDSCDILDREFPLEESLVPLLISTIVKELLGAEYRPADLTNNSNDDLSDIIAWARRNMKSNVLQLIEG